LAHAALMRQSTRHPNWFSIIGSLAGLVCIGAGVAALVQADLVTYMPLLMMAGSLCTLAWVMARRTACGRDQQAG